MTPVTLRRDRIPSGCAPDRPGQASKARPATCGRRQYESEYRGILALKHAGRGDVELHGHTHMHPDSARWAAAPDRYQRTDWFRELGASALATIASRPADQHPLALGLRARLEHFESKVTTLISPGDQWTNETLGRALDLSLQLVCSYYWALRHDGRFCWSTHLCAPYLDEPAEAWFDSGLPVCGYFHDRELALEGVDWLSRRLDRWQDAGARRFIDLGELAALLGRRYDVITDAGAPYMRIDRAGAPALLRPFSLLLRTHGQELPRRMPVELDGVRSMCEIERVSDGCGRFAIPVVARPD